MPKPVRLARVVIQILQAAAVQQAEEAEVTTEVEALPEEIVEPDEVEEDPPGLEH